MSAFMDQNESETVSTSAKATLLRSSCNDESPSSRRSNYRAESAVQEAHVELSQGVGDTGPRRVLGSSSHEEDAEANNTSALEFRHHGETCETSCHHCSDGKQLSGFGGTDGDAPAPKGEQQEIRSKTREPSPVSRCDDLPGRTHSTRAGRESLTDASQSLAKKTPSMSGPSQSGSGTCLSPKQPCADTASGVNISRGRMPQAQEGFEEKRRGEASLSADSRAKGKPPRCPRPVPAESRATDAHQETPRRSRGAESNQMPGKAEKAKSPAGSAEGVTNAPGPTSEKESNGPRLSQQSSAINSVRRPLTHKVGRRPPTQHSISSRSLPGSRRTSVSNATEAEKKHALSRGSTMDTDGASTISQVGCKRNFIRENMQNARAQQHQRQTKPAKGKPEPPRRHSSFGKIPQYLSHIKSQLREEAKKALDKEAADKLPPGMRVMGNEERLETVRRLKKEQKEAEQELARMPIAIKTNAQRRRMDYLERRLGELDREQQKYSKPNILVGV